MVVGGARVVQGAAEEDREAIQHVVDSFEVDCGSGPPNTTQAPEPQAEAPPEPQEDPATQPELEPGAVTLSGSGQEATEMFQLEPGLAVISMAHQGDANFIVDLLDQNGNTVAPMGVANVIGPFEGSTPVQVQQEGQYLLDVQAGGSWEIAIEQPSVEDAPEKTSFSGTSQQATELFQLSGGLRTFEMTHQGDSNFIVDLLDENGASVAPMGLVNEIGPFDGSKALQVPEDGVYLLSVQANGPWTIQID